MDEVFKVVYVLMWGCMEEGEEEGKCYAKHPASYLVV